MKHFMAAFIALIVAASPAIQAHADDKRIELERRIELLEQEVSKIRRDMEAPNVTAESKYTDEVIGQVRENWFFPEDLAVQKDDFLRVAIEISEDGTFAEPEVVKSSGNEPFNSYALECLSKSTPLPPIPAEIGKDTVELELLFRPPQN